jgi:hypothetical protein
VLRVFASFAIVTGSLDIIAGTQVLTGGGAHLSPDVAADPVLNSQIKYLGAIWVGFGAALWWTTRDLRGRSVMLHILLGAVFLGGIGRLLSALQFGMGPPLLTAFIVIELVGPVLVLVWRHRLVNRRLTNSGT